MTYYDPCLSCSLISTSELRTLLQACHFRLKSHEKVSVHSGESICLYARATPILLMNSVDRTSGKR